MRFFKQRLLIGMIQLALAASAHAEKTIDLVPPIPSAPLFSGYIDSSYNYLQQSNELTSGNLNRQFDIEENGFTLQQLSLTLQHQLPQGLGGYINLIGGSDANEITLKGWNPYFGSQTLALIVPEAYLRYKKDALSISAGLQGSLVGEESYLYTNNVNFSRSVTNDFAEPGRHIGFRITVDASDQLALIVGANNGWSTLEGPGRLTTMELGANYRFNPATSLAVQLYNGPQGLSDDTDTGRSGTRQLVNAILTYHATPTLDLVANIDYATQTKAALPHGEVGGAVWKGIVGYANYQFTDQWMASLRAEVFSDQNGYRTGVAQSWREATVTVGYQVLKNLLLRAETRHDTSSAPAFLTSSHLGASHQQQSYALEGLYTF